MLARYIDSINACTSCHSAAAVRDPSNGIHPPAHPLPLSARCIRYLLYSMRGAASKCTVPARLRCGVECGRCWWRHLPARQVILSSGAGDTVHGRLRLGAAMAPCTRRGPSVPLCGSLWPSLDRRPTTPPACSCRCALAPPIGCGASSPPLRTPARDASKSCPPADHPQTLNAAPTSRSALCSALLPSTANRHQQAYQASKQLAGRAAQCGIQCSAVQCSPAQFQPLSSRHPEKRPGAPPSSWPAANRFLLQPRTLPFSSSSLFQLALPAVIPIIPQTLRLLLARTPRKSGVIGSASYNTSFARIQAYRLIVPLFSPPE